MDILLVMCAGVLLGARWFPQKLYRFNANLQLLCTVILIFSMGVSLGARPQFFEELSTLGVQSLFFCLLPIAGSVALVYPLTQRFLAAQQTIGAEEGHGSSRDC